MACNKCKDECNPKDCECQKQECGCKFEVSTDCVRYCGIELPCIDANDGALLGDIIRNINEKFCDYMPPEDGQGIDHVSFTSTTGTSQGEEGQTDTYTVWGDSSETINLGDFLVYNGADGEDGVDGNDIYDSGWKQIPHYTSANGYGFANILNFEQPYIRIIGREVFIRGRFIIPLAFNGSTTSFIDDRDVYKDSPTLNIKTFTGTNGGFSIQSGGSMTTNQPILPSILAPSRVDTHYIVFGTRSTSFEADGPSGPSKQNVNLDTVSTRVSIFTDGRVFFGGLYDRLVSAITGTNNNFTSLSNEKVTRIDEGDEFIDYDSYRTSFSSGGADQRTPVSSGVVCPVNIDCRKPNDWGGFEFDFNYNYLLDESTPISNIENAFNNL